MSAGSGSASAPPLRRGRRGGRGGRAGRDVVVPEAEFRSYYGRPILQEPVWTWEIPTYFFTGGLAGAGALLAAAAGASGRPGLARAARRATLAATIVSPPLLISDLGRPARFHHMLRVFKPTSPMSVGSWILAVFGTAAGAAGVFAELGWFPRLQRLAGWAAAALGPAMSTYTAVLVSDTAVPVWHDAHRELPFVFAGGSAASAAGAALLGAPPREAAPARVLAVAGAVVELAAVQRMKTSLGDRAEPLETGTPGLLANAARALTVVGGALAALGSRRRAGAARLGGLCLLAGSAAERWAVYLAGFESARDPKYVVAPQRQRIAELDGDGR